jgi:hypothetical protein
VPSTLLKRSRGGHHRAGPWVAGVLGKVLGVWEDLRGSRSASQRVWAPHPRDALSGRTRRDKRSKRVTKSAPPLGGMSLRPGAPADDRAGRTPRSAQSQPGAALPRPTGFPQQTGARNTCPGECRRSPAGTQWCPESWVARTSEWMCPAVPPAPARHIHVWVVPTALPGSGATRCGACPTLAPHTTARHKNRPCVPPKAGVGVPRGRATDA